MRRSAHAKINVSLHVLGRRPDGYHDIDSLIVPVSLADELTFRVAPELRLTVRVDVEVPIDDRNLVIVAAETLAAASDVESGADIELDKRIPVAAGLGGGSADAAATLLGLKRTTLVAKMRRRDALHRHVDPVVESTGAFPTNGARPIALSRSPL